MVDNPRLFQSPIVLGETSFLLEDSPEDSIPTAVRESYRGFTGVKK